MADADATSVLAFWREAGPEKWFAKDDAFDAEIRRRFAGLHADAAAGRLDGWENDAEDAYALIILLDQFSRNLNRGSAEAFANDAYAVEVAERAIENGFDQSVDNPERRFFYLPFQHAEDFTLQERSVALSKASGDEDSVKWAVIHRDIIRDFGRFPHRNAVLGRETTPAEQSFLDADGFKG